MLEMIVAAIVVIVMVDGRNPAPPTAQWLFNDVTS